MENPAQSVQDAAERLARKSLPVYGSAGMNLTILNHEPDRLAVDAAKIIAAFAEAHPETAAKIDADLVAAETKRQQAADAVAEHWRQMAKFPMPQLRPSPPHPAEHS